MDPLRRTFATTYVRVAGVVLLLVLIVAVLGGSLAPDDPLGQGDAIFAHAGTSGHLLGTDYVGRDVLSRLLAGAGPSVLSAAAMVGVGLLLGALPGVVSAFAGRFTAFGLLRFTDALMTLPPIVFAIAMIAPSSPSLKSPAIAIAKTIGVLLAPRFFRIARAETLGFAHQQYVEAATLLGASRTWLVRRHIWRKVLPTIAVTTATSAGYAVLAAASLGFLGLGVQAPDPTWGGMLAANVEHLAEDSWAPIWPGIFIALTAWSLNALADGLRDGLAVESGVSRLAVDDPEAVLAGVPPAASVPPPVEVLPPPATSAVLSEVRSAVDAPAGAGESAAPAPVLDVRGLRVAVPGVGGSVDAVHGVDLRVARGEALGLVGESGSGKTLTCRAVLGVLPGRCTVAGGSIDLGGTDLTTLSPAGWRAVHASRIGAVFQDPASYLNPSQAVGRQLAEVLRVKAGLGRRAARERALELFASVGLKRPEAVYRQIPGQLSGGMQQRVMLAIALSCDPQLLVADEPTTALDVKTQAEIVSLLRDLRERIGLSLLFVSHDLAVVTELCDRIAVFRDGGIVEEAATTDLLAGRAAHPYTRSLLRAAGLLEEDARVA